MHNRSDILYKIYTSIFDEKEKEYFEIHEVRYQFILEKIQSLGLSAKAKILDIGVYPPHLFKAFHELGHDVFGISSRHERVSVKNVSILNIEKDHFPYTNNEFNLVVMTEVIEHLTGNPRVYLDEIRRVLKPNGFLLITTPNAVHLKNRAKVLIGQSPAFPVDQLLETKQDDDSIYFRHNREFTKEELTKIVVNSGFTVKTARYFSAYTPFRRFKKTNVIKYVGYMFTRLIPSFRDSILLIAERKEAT
jgi:2-polyprenyl-3-methyl-5-hydroxy-6-metoxy-1,4-benzoquinol methylase